MDTADPQFLSRISKMLLAGIGVAFAWLLLSVVLGLSSSHAHADDDSGLIDGLGSTLTGAASSVTDVVAGTTSAVTQTVVPAVQQAVSAPPAPPAAPVAQTVSPVVTPVISGINSAVAAVPIVGDTSAAFGLDTALSAVGTSVDTVLAGITAAASETVSGVLDPITGLAPGVIPPVSGILDGVLAPTVTATMTTDAAPQPLEALVRAASLAFTTTWIAMTNPGAAASSADSSVTGTAGFGGFTLLRSVLQADSAFTGPGGAGLGAWVLVALGPVVAYRAWMRRSGLENDVAPAAPALSTDVSPD